MVFHCHALHFYEPSRTANGSQQYVLWSVGETLVKELSHRSIVGRVAQVYIHRCRVSVYVHASLVEQGRYILPHISRVLYYVTGIYYLPPVVYRGRA